MKKIEWNKLADNEYRELYRRWMSDPNDDVYVSAYGYVNGYDI